MNFFLLTLLPVLETVAITAMYLPQIAKTIRTKDVKAQATSFWLLLVIALTARVTTTSVLFATGNSISLAFLITAIVNLTLATVMLVLVIKYRNKRIYDYSDVGTILVAKGVR